MKKKILLAFFSIALLILGGLGCKGISAEQQASIQPISVNYWTIFNDVATLQQLAEEYKQIRPYVNVNIRQVRLSEFDNLFLNALADDVAPDIISVHNQSISKYISRLSAMPSTVNVANVQIKGKYAKEVVVTNEQNKMPSINTIKANYIKTVADDTIINGKKYGLPLALDTLAIYYNKDLLDRSGIALPPSTWEEFLQAVKETTKFNTSGDIIQSGVALGTSKNIPRSFDILSLLMLQNGVVMEQNGRATFSDNFKNLGSNHPSLESLRFYTDFARPTKEVYSWNDTMEDALSSFVRGKTVFYFGYAYDKKEIKRRAPQMNVDVIPVPQLNDVQPVNVASYWVESVVKKSKHQNEAWDFIRFITSPNNAKRYTTKTNQPTALRAQIEEQKDISTIAPFIEQILNVKNWYHGNNIEIVKESFGEMIDKYKEPYSEKTSPIERDANLVIDAAKSIQRTY